VQGLVC